MKVHIIGGAGSGKSHLSRALSTDLSINHYELDRIFWDDSAEGYNSKSPVTERDSKLNVILSKDEWIIEGVYYKWLYQSFSDADIIIMLTPSIWVQNYRAIRRFIRRKLNLEHSNKKETLDGLIKLLKWNYGYNKDKLGLIHNFISEFEDKITIVRNNSEARRIINSISENTNL